MNSVNLIGYVSDNPEIKIGKKDTRYVSLVIGVPEGYSYVKTPCIAFNEVAERVYTKCVKGQLVGIQGHLGTPRLRKFGDEEIYQVSIVVDRLTTYKGGTIKIEQAQANDEYVEGSDGGSD